MVAHFTMRRHGVNQTFWFVEGIWLHRKSHQIGYFYPKRPIFLHACATWNEQPSNIKTMDTLVGQKVWKNNLRKGYTHRDSPLFSTEFIVAWRLPSLLRGVHRLYILYVLSLSYRFSFSLYIYLYKPSIESNQWHFWEHLTLFRTNANINH